MRLLACFPEQPRAPRYRQLFTAVVRGEEAVHTCLHIEQASQTALLVESLADPVQYMNSGSLVQEDTTPACRTGNWDCFYT